MGTDYSASRKWPTRGSYQEDAGVMNFATLIRPLAPRTFWNLYWGIKPLYICRDNERYYETLFSKFDLDFLLAQSRIRCPELALFRDGDLLPVENLLAAGWYSEPKSGADQHPDMSPLYDAYLAGHTIMVRLDRLWYPVMHLVRNLEAVSNHPAIAELFATPKQAQGFTLHFDDYEGFVLQLEGIKHWQIYPPVQPRATETGDGVPRSSEELRKTSGAPIHNFTLHPGDLLYIPRFFPHCATTSESASLHLTVAFRPVQWKDLIIEALEAVSAHNPEFYAALCPGFMRDDHDGPSYQDRLRHLLRIFSEQASAKVGIQRLLRRFCEKPDPLSNASFTHLDGLTHIDTDSVVGTSDSIISYASTDGEVCRMYFSGQELQFSLSCEEAVHYIQMATEPFIVGQLPGDIDPATKVLIVKTLISAGLLYIVTG